MANDVQTSKVTGYAVMAPDPRSLVSKTTAYAVMAPVAEAVVSKTVAYAVMAPPPVAPGDVKISNDDLQVLGDAALPQAVVRISNDDLQVLSDADIPQAVVRISNNDLQVLGNLTVAGKVVLEWDDASDVETEFRVYRSTAPMDPQALPAPLAVLAADVVLYQDIGNFAEGAPLYYRVSAVAEGQELVSGELVVTPPDQSEQTETPDP